jgi:hypothetical protein
MKHNSTDVLQQLQWKLSLLCEMMFYLPTVIDGMGCIWIYILNYVALVTKVLLQSVILTFFLQCTEWWYVWPQGESFYNPYIPGVIEQLDKLGLVEESDGARVIYVEGVNIPLIAVKRDGGYNYFSTDLASLWLVLPYRFFVHIFE